MISRRAFLARSGTLTAGLTAWRGGLTYAQAPPTYFNWESPKEGVRFARGGGGASLVVSSGGESLLVDCKRYGLGTTLRREVESDTTTLVAVVNTHHHRTPAGGNFAFTPDLPVIAQRRAARRILSSANGILESLRGDTEGDIIARRRQLIADMAYSTEGARAALADFDAHVATLDDIVAGSFGPTVVFDESYTGRVGGLDFELYHFGRAHTDNDLVVWVPGLDVMHVGNLVEVDAHPLIDVGRGGDTRSWQSYLRRVLPIVGPQTLLLPSDGELVANVHDIEAQIEYFDRLRGLAQGAIDAGMSRQETVDFIPTTNLGRFSGLARSEQLATNLGIVYDELDVGR